jgi:hypothetical protein
MSAEVFGGTVDYHIYAKLVGCLVNGAGKSIVDHRNEVIGPGQLYSGRYVRYSEQGI